MMHKQYCVSKINLFFHSPIPTTVPFGSEGGRGDDAEGTGILFDGLWDRFGEDCIAFNGTDMRENSKREKRRWRC